MGGVSDDELRRAAGRLSRDASVTHGFSPYVTDAERNRDVLAVADAVPALLDRVAKLEAAVRELLPFAATGVRAVNDGLVGRLYPAVNVAVLDRAEALLRPPAG